MSFLFIMLAIFSMAAFFSIVLKEKFDIVAALPFFLIIIATYISGLLGDLRYGVYLILIFSAFCFVFCFGYILRFGRKCKSSLARVFTTGFFAFIIFSGIMLFGHLGRPFENWDEFAHWGATVKGMYMNNTFSSANNAPIFVKHEGYPPGTALLHYFFTKCAGTYHESNIIRSMGVFAFSLFLPVFEHVPLKRGHYLRSLIFFSVILLLPTVIYSDFYVTLYVDGILDVLFGYMLYAYFSNREITPVFLLRFSAAAFVAALVKSSGAAFAAIALIIISADIIFFRRRKIQLKIGPANFAVPEAVKSLCGLLLPVLAIALSRGTWKAYLQETQSAEWSISGITLSGLITLFTQSIPDYQLEGIIAFVERFTSIRPFINNTGNTAVELSYPINISYVLFIVAVFIVAAVIVRLVNNPQFAKAFRVTTGLVVLGFLGYAVSLLVLYLFTFQKWETVSCAAMDRYLGSYLLGTILFMASMLLQSIPSDCAISRLKLKPNRFLAAVLCFVLCFANVNSIAKITVSSHFDILRIQRMRCEYSTAQWAGENISSDSGQVFILSQDTSWYYYNLCRYSLAPLRSSFNVNYDLTGMTDPEAIEAKVSSLKNVLANYQYVYVRKTDDTFVTYYGELFENPDDIVNDSFFTVNNSENGILLTRLNID